MVPILWATLYRSTCSLYATRERRNGNEKPNKKTDKRAKSDKSMRVCEVDYTACKNNGFPHRKNPAHCIKQIQMP